MAGDILTYSPSQVKLVVCGYTLTGLVSISLKWNSQPFTVKKGIRGVHTRIGTPDRQSCVTLEVLQTSITNDILSEILEQDTRNYSGRLEIALSDSSGTTQWSSSQCFLKAWPDSTYGMGLETRKWDIEILAFSSGKIGGNSRQGFDLLDAFDGASDYVSGLIGSASSAVSSAADSVSDLF